MSALVFERAPLRVYWELTRACDLACRHCRAEAQPFRRLDELPTLECERVLRELASTGHPAPHVIFTGGDPLKRPDLVHLVRYGTDRGLGMSVAPSATPGLSRDLVDHLKAAGVSAMSLSLDGPTAAHHDGIRGVLGCFGSTLVAAQRIVGAGILLQINTLVAAETEPHLEEVATLVAGLGAARWSLFFLVNVGRGQTLRSLSPIECERTLRWLVANGGRWPFTVTTTEAPHYRRVVIQRMRAEGRTSEEIHSSPAARGFGIRDGNGIMFIAANGDVTPSGFLPLVAGTVRQTNPLTIYRDSALFRALRTPEVFRGRCGVCQFRRVCGGSRARAWASGGDVLGEDPLCAWEPRAA
ncbi:MAG TPA: TIGR04053 family radical SAM/SPASM domain-containing protein [Methylomirabilota bacterium]|nr:TIGR04053 family radical SAM/SPASM domain-containing protein [Methylomirabilota bacterium]